MKKIILIILILLTLASACLIINQSCFYSGHVEPFCRFIGVSKFSQNWTGFYHPNGRGGGEECGVEFDTKEACKAWGKAKMKSGLDAEHYYCGYACVYNRFDPCQRGCWDSPQQFLEYEGRKRCQKLVWKNMEDREQEELFCAQYLEALLQDSETGSSCLEKQISDKQTSESGEIYYAIFDDCYWEQNSPLDFLEDLKSHPLKALRIAKAPTGWITEEHIPELMKLKNSTEPAAPVVFFTSQFSRDGEVSTIGREAAFLIEGFTKGTYPPRIISSLDFKGEKVPEIEQNTFLQPE